MHRNGGVLGRSEGRLFGGASVIYSAQPSQLSRLDRNTAILTGVDTMAEQTKQKKAPRPKSKERIAAMAAVAAAKSEQEKAVAMQALKLLRFKEVASVRTGAALKHLQNLESTCDTSTYAWTEDQATKILGAIEPVVAKLRKGLMTPSKRKAESTKFAL